MGGFPTSGSGSGGGGSSDATSIAGVAVKTTAPAGPFATDKPVMVKDVAGTLYVVGSINLPVAGGGTGAADASGARSNLSAAVVGGSAAVAGSTGSTTPTFSGTTPPTALVSILSGAGMTAAGQNMTSTDNQTATLNQYTGCVLATAIANSMLYIVGNAACTGAPLVLTVLGTPVTDAGAYYIFGAPTPAGSVTGHTHTAGTLSATQV